MRRLSLMMALACMAYCLYIKEAWQQRGHQVSRYKQHRSRKHFAAISSFRRGIAEFEKYVFCLRLFLCYLCKVLQNIQTGRQTV